MSSQIDLLILYFYRGCTREERNNDIITQLINRIINLINKWHVNCTPDSQYSCYPTGSTLDGWNLPSRKVPANPNTWGLVTEYYVLLVIKHYTTQPIALRCVTRNLCVRIKFKLNAVTCTNKRQVKCCGVYE